MRKILFLFILLLSLISAPASSKAKGVELPSPAFEVNQKRSDPNRPVRPHGRKYRGPIIDTHTHLYPPRKSGGSMGAPEGKKWSGASDIDEGNLGEILGIVRDAGVDLIIFMPTPNDGIRDNHELGVEKRKMIRDMDKSRVRLFCGSNYITTRLHYAYPDKYSEEEIQNILQRLKEDMDSGIYSGVGELAVYHFDKGFRGQHVLKIPPNFDPFLRIVDLIARKGMWLDLHAEPVDPKGKSYEKEVFGGIELFYQKNPDLKLIYSHTAMTNPTNARRILKKYPNIMMNIKAIKKHQWWTNLEPVVSTQGELYEDWAELFEEMPERFMVGTDMHFGRKGVPIQNYRKKIKQMRRILGALKPKAARMIAYENAKRVFK